MNTRYGRNDRICNLCARKDGQRRALEICLAPCKRQGRICCEQNGKVSPSAKAMDLFFCKDSLGSRFFITSFQAKKSNPNRKGSNWILVGMTGFEPATSCSQSKRATNCATSRFLYLIMKTRYTLSHRNRAPRRAEQPLSVICFARHK